MGGLTEVQAARDLAAVAAATWAVAVAEVSWEVMEETAAMCRVNLAREAARSSKRRLQSLPVPCSRKSMAVTVPEADGTDGLSLVCVLRILTGRLT